MPSTNHRPQDHRLKYTEIFILSKGPQIEEGASGSLGPPNQPRLEGVLSPQSPDHSPEELPSHSAEPLLFAAPICNKGRAPFQRGPKASSLLKNDVPRSLWSSLQAWGEQASSGRRCGWNMGRGCPAAPSPARRPQAAVRMGRRGVRLPHGPPVGSGQALEHEGV